MNEVWRDNPIAKRAINWASAKVNPMLGSTTPTGLKKIALNMAKSTACKASAGTVRKAVSMMPDEILTEMIRSSPMCQSGGKRSGHKRKTRKQKRNARKTRKH
jgi:hypothetical protein